MASTAGDRDRRGAPLGGASQAALDSIDSENRCGALEERAAQRAQADRAEADHRDCAAVTECRRAGPPPSRWRGCR